jgi:BspA type Leucine rich repeat region (6 copies)
MICTSTDIHSLKPHSFFFYSVFSSAQHNTTDNDATNNNSLCVLRWSRDCRLAILGPGHSASWYVGACCISGARRRHRNILILTTRSFLPSCIPSFLIDSAFRGCTKLQTVTLPNTIRTIGFGTFQDCIRLQRVQLPQDVKRLEACLFANCQQLHTITTTNTTTTVATATTTTTTNNINNFKDITKSGQYERQRQQQQHRSLMDEDDDEEEGTIQLPSMLLSIGTSKRYEDTVRY